MKKKKGEKCIKASAAKKRESVWRIEFCINYIFIMHSLCIRPHFPHIVFLTQQPN
jgi:hypothetical protein